jgi:hypothetical protein
MSYHDQEEKVRTRPAFILWRNMNESDEERQKVRNKLRTRYDCHFNLEVESTSSPTRKPVTKQRTQDFEIQMWCFVRTRK